MHLSVTPMYKLTGFQTGESLERRKELMLRASHPKDLERYTVLNTENVRLDGSKRPIKR